MYIYLKYRFIQRHSTQDKLSCRQGVVLPIVYQNIEKQHGKPTPLICKRAFNRVTVICVRRGIIPDDHIAKVVEVSDRVGAGDLSLIDEIAENAQRADPEVREFVLGSEEAARQLPIVEGGAASSCSSNPLLEVAMRGLSPEERARMLAHYERLRASPADTASDYKLNLAKQRKRQALELARDKELHAIEIQALREEKNLHLEKLRRQNQEDCKQHEIRMALKSQEAHEAQQQLAQALLDSEHRRTLDQERRRSELQQAAGRGEIDADRARALAGGGEGPPPEPILSLERWLGEAGNRINGCRPGSCCSVLGRRFNEAIANGQHAKPQAHWDAERQRWRLFKHFDGPKLRELHQGIHDQRAGLGPGQQRLGTSLFSRLQQS